MCNNGHSAVSNTTPLSLLSPSPCRKRIDVSDTLAFFLVINNKSLASGNTALGEVYRQEKDADGFLYIVYSSQETFG